MRPHHKQAIEKLTKSFENQNKYLALIITGSVAKGLEREDSDIDVVVVVSEDEYQKMKKRKRLFYYTTNFCEYPGGYIDGKVVSLDFLKLIAERGSEVARDLFRGSWIAYSTIPELEDILKKILVYPKEEKNKKIQKFYAQFEYNKWFIDEAVKRKDNYALLRGVTDLVLFGGRLILAHNEILYPYHKLFTAALERAPDKPENFMKLLNTLLKVPNHNNALAFYEAIKNFRKWEIKEAWPIQFLFDTELAWVDGKAYVGDL